MPLKLLLTDEEILAIAESQPMWRDGDIIWTNRAQVIAKAQRKKVGDGIDERIQDMESNLSVHVKDNKSIRDLSLKNDIVIAQLELKGSIIGLKELRQALLDEVKDATE